MQVLKSLYLMLWRDFMYMGNIKGQVPTVSWLTVLEDWDRETVAWQGFYYQALEFSFSLVPKNTEEGESSAYWNILDTFYDINEILYHLMYITAW